MTKIEFLFRGDSLGIFEVCERSTQRDRDTVAEENGIKQYDEVILDDGRVHCELVSVEKDYFIDYKDRLWKIL